MDLYCQFYDGRLRTSRNWGLAINLLDQQMYQKCSAARSVWRRAIWHIHATSWIRTRSTSRSAVGTLHPLGCGHVCQIKYRIVELLKSQAVLFYVHGVLACVCRTARVCLVKGGWLFIYLSCNLVTRTQFYWTALLSADVTAALAILPTYVFTVWLGTLLTGLF